MRPTNVIRSNRRSRPNNAVSSPRGSITVTLCFMARRLRLSKNNLARVVCQRRGRTDAAHLLQSLHWLPVQNRITYKTAVLTHKVLTTSAPSYLSDMLHTAAPARQLRSAAAPLFIVPRTPTDIAGRAFCMAAPSVSVSYTHLTLPTILRV